MSEWKETTLGNLIDIKHGWAFKGEFFNKTNQPNNIVVAIGNFDYSGGFRFDSTRTKEYLDTYPQEYELVSGDILLAMTCQTAGGEILGIPGRIPNDGKVYLHNQRLGKVEIKDIEETNPSFIYWLCLWQTFNHHLVATATGTKILHTAPERIKSFVFECPPIDEQKQIGKTLDVLDRKIENLRKQNETLEAIAQALFKHWFVDFEFPNADGKPYKSSGGAMEPSELGDIPADWRVGSLGDVIKVNFESIGKGYPHKEIEYVDISSVGVGVLEGTTSYPLKKAPSRARRLVKHGDVIWSGVRPNRKSYLFIAHPLKNIVVSTGFITLTPDLIPSSYLYSLVTTDSFVEYLSLNASGSAYPAVKSEHFEIAEILLPDKFTLRKFHAVVDPMREKIYQNSRQIQTLTQTRDVLLPKLMSGKLRITS